MPQALHAAGPVCARVPRASLRCGRRTGAAPHPSSAPRRPPLAGAALPRRTALVTTAVSALSARPLAAAAMSHVAAATAPSSSDLLIVGPGVLGSMVGALWLQAFPGARVVGQTNTTSSHERLRAAGITPRTKAEASSAGRFAHVIFCAPPSGSSDYAAEVASAGALWDGSGAFVFTSSSAVYPDSDGLACDERTPALLLGASPRADGLLRAEESARAAGGAALRLAGLYTRGRGAHTYFMRQPEVPARGDGYLNLLHYGDAATAAVAALRRSGAEGRGATYIACDGTPVTREEMMRVALASGLFPDGAMPRFTGPPTAPRGRRMDCPATRAALGWAPRFTSFAAFMAAGAPE